MKKPESLKEKRENKKFIKEQLKRYREEISKYTPGANIFVTSRVLSQSLTYVSL